MQDAQVRSPRGSLGDCIVHRVRRATGVLQIQVRRFWGSYMVSTQALATRRTVQSLAALKGRTTLLAPLGSANLEHRFCKESSMVFMLRIPLWGSPIPLKMGENLVKKACLGTQETPKSQADGTHPISQWEQRGSLQPSLLSTSIYSSSVFLAATISTVEDVEFNFVFFLVGVPKKLHPTSL